MRRESLLPFLPAALAAVTDVLTTRFVLGHQPDYPGRFIVFQIVMFGAALLAAVPNKWVRFVGFVLLLVGVFYLPAFFAVVWLMVRDGRNARSAKAG
jgi:cell division protein FtsW (lipid II flippase)